MKQVFYHDLGLIDYKEAWDFQSSLFDKIVETKLENRKREKQEKTQNHLIFCEHPHVFTLGKSGSEDNLLINEQELIEKKATYYKINRGGDITYHGPGQIVGYPIFDLDNFFTDIHKYLRLLEETIILGMKEFNISAGRIKGLTGVWVDADNPVKARKICAMGVHASRWVTMHGFALNVNTDVNYFNNIVPCGISDKAVTSMQLELGKQIDINEVKAILKKHMAQLFEFDFAEEIKE